MTLIWNLTRRTRDLKLSVGVRRDVLLIFKEAVNNAAKHSDCSKVTIDFNCQNSVLSLRIQDDGKGFETDSENDGQGLRSMTRRADALGGNLTIESDSEDGTIITFKMPLLNISRICTDSSKYPARLSNYISLSLLDINVQATNSDFSD